VIPYIGLPITPDAVAIEAVKAGNAFVSFAHPGQLGLAVEVCKSFALDNGAFPAWRSGNPITDWAPFYAWAAEAMHIPHCDFAVVPDVIDGTEDDNDALVAAWPFPKWFGAPVWHMHESIYRLMVLAAEWPRICIGSSGEYAVVGNTKWWARITEAFRAICDNQGRPYCKVHGLRMLNPKVFTRLPLASADSTNIGRNVGVDKNWSSGVYLPMTKRGRAMVMRERLEAFNAPATFKLNP